MPGDLNARKLKSIRAENGDFFDYIINLYMRNVIENAERDGAPPDIDAGIAGVIRARLRDTQSSLELAKPATGVRALTDAVANRYTSEMNDVLGKIEGTARVIDSHASQA